ncbi:MAG: hypothetical protein HY924_04985 [Elusimicrobia bacterium]|nr:hypothetical protein [Elusimicrobiota bacterium]
MKRGLGRRGQSAVEYLLTTLMLVTFFVGLYGFLHQQVRKMFILGGTKILMMYD